MKTSKKSLEEFFSLNPHYFQMAIQGYPAHYPSNPEIWEVIFHYMFGEMPTDRVKVDVAYTVPRPGSNDPRWCTLLSKSGYGFMNEMNHLIETHFRDT